MKKIFFSVLAAIFCNANLYAQGLDFTASPTSGSFPLTVTFTNTSTNQSAYKYIWYFGDGATVTDFNTTTITHTYTNAGIYTPQFDAYTITDSLLGSVTNGSSGNITVLNPLMVSVSSSNVYCTGMADGTATVTPTGGDGQYSYYWSPGLQTTQTVSGLSPGIYTVTVTDLSSSQITDTVFITEPTPLNVSVTSANISCNGLNDGTATATVTGGTPTGGTPGYSFNWTPYLGAMSFEPTIFGLQPGIYTVEITDANGCKDTVPATITQPPPLYVTANASATNVCLGFSVTFTGGGANTYTWTGGVTNGIDFFPSFNNSYVVTGTDTNNCSASDTVFVTVNSPPIVDAGLNQNVCLGNNVDFSGTAAGGTSSYWAFGDGGTSSLLNPTHAYSSPGTYSVTHTASSATSGCSSTDTAIITINPLPTVTAYASPSSVCDGNSVSLTSSSTGGSTYAWSGPNGFSSSLQNPAFIATAAAAGTYTVTASANGCFNTATTTLIVNPLPAITANASPGMVCDGNSVSLTSSSTGGSSYSWSGPNGFSSSLQNPAIIGTTASAGTYTVTASANGCFNSATATLLVNPLPTVTASASPGVVCEGNSVILTSSAIGGGTYSWSGPNGFSSIIQNPSITAVVAATGTYTVTVIANGCVNTTTTTLIVNPIPNVTISGSQNICNGDSAFISASGYGGTPGYTYSWNTGPNTSTIVVSPNTTTNYYVTCTDINGCFSSTGSSINVNVNTDISGIVSYSGGVLASGGTAVLFHHYQTYTAFDTALVSTIDPVGNYHFTAVNSGDYLIKIFVDTTNYPTLSSTYYGNEWAWDSALVIAHGCNLNDTANIVMLEETGTGGGTGFLQGQIVEGVGFGRIEGGPIPGVDVKLGRNPGGIIVSSGTTDISGYYRFAGVSDGNYTIYVDIPGLGTDSSYTIDVDATASEYLYLNYNVDSTTIHYVPDAGVGISNPSLAASTKFNVYPNPFRGNTTIEYSVSSESHVTLEVVNILGVRIKSLVNSKQAVGNYKCNLNNQTSALRSGIYFITLAIDGKESTQRIVVIE